MKPLYDAAKAAEANAQAVLDRMLQAFEAGTEEGVANAVGMRAELDAAKAEADAANATYLTAREVAQTGADDNARKFVPVGQKPTDQTKQITRSEYEAMDYADRHAFFKAGGSIVDNPGQ